MKRDSATERTHLLGDDLDALERGEPAPQVFEGELYETDRGDASQDQPIITLIRDPNYSVPDDIGDRVFDDAATKYGSDLDYATLYALLTTPPEWHEPMRRAHRAIYLSTPRKMAWQLADLHFEYYPWVLPTVMVSAFFLSRIFAQLIDAISTDPLGDSELNWKSILPFMIVLSAAIFFQKMAKEYYLNKRGEREAEFCHDYFSFLKSNPQTTHPDAIVHPRTKKDYQRFYAFHTGFLAWLKANKKLRAIDGVLASFARHFPYVPQFREENIGMDVPEEFDRDRPELKQTENPHEVPLVSDDDPFAKAKESGRLVKPSEVLPKIKHHGRGDEWQVKSAMGERIEEMTGLRRGEVGRGYLPHLIPSQTQASTPAKPAAKKPSTSQKRRVCDVFSLPLITGGTHTLESGESVKITGLASAKKTDLEKARRIKTTSENPVSPPEMNSKNCMIYMASFVGDLLAPVSYQLSLEPLAGRYEEGKIYLRNTVTSHEETGEKILALGYRYLEAGSIKEGVITAENIPSLQDKIGRPLDLEELKLFLPEMLQVTGCRGHGAFLNHHRNYSHTALPMEQWLRRKFTYSSPRKKLFEIMLERNPCVQEAAEEAMSISELGSSGVVQPPDRLQVASEEARRNLTQMAGQHHEAILMTSATSALESVQASAPSIQEAPPRMIPVPVPAAVSVAPPLDLSPEQGRAWQTLGRQLLCLSCPGAIDINNNVAYASPEFFSYEDPYLLEDVWTLEEERRARYFRALLFSGHAGKIKALSLVHNPLIPQAKYFNFIQTYLACSKKDKMPAGIIANHLCFLVERPEAYDEMASDKKHKTQALFENNPQLACEILVALTAIDNPVPILHAQRLFYENPVSSRVRRSIIERLTKNKHDLCMSKLLLISFNEISKVKIAVNPTQDRYFDLRYLFNSKNKDHLKEVYGLIAEMAKGDLGRQHAQGVAYYFTKKNRLEEFLDKKDKALSNAEELAKKLNEMPDQEKAKEPRARLVFALMRAAIFRKKGLFKKNQEILKKPILVRSLCEAFYSSNENIDFVDAFLQIGLQARSDAWRVNEEHFRKIFQYCLHKPQRNAALSGDLSTESILRSIKRYYGKLAAGEDRQKHREVLYALLKVFIPHRLSIPVECEALVATLDREVSGSWSAVAYGDLVRVACSSRIKLELLCPFLLKLMNTFYQENVLISQRMAHAKYLMKHENACDFGELWLYMAEKLVGEKQGQLTASIIQEMLGTYAAELPLNPTNVLMRIFCQVPNAFSGKNLAHLLLWLFLPREKTDYKKFARPFLSVFEAFRGRSLPKIIMEHDTTIEGRTAAYRCAFMMIYSLHDQLYWKDGKRTLVGNKDLGTIINVSSQMYRVLNDLREVAGRGVKIDAFIKKVFDDLSFCNQMGFYKRRLVVIGKLITRINASWDTESQKYIGEYLDTEDLYLDETVFLMDSENRRLLDSDTDTEEDPMVYALLHPPAAQKPEPAPGLVTIADPSVPNQQADAAESSDQQEASTDDDKGKDEAVVGGHAQQAVVDADGDEEEESTDDESLSFGR